MIIGNYYIKLLIQKVTELDKIYDWYTLKYSTKDVVCIRKGAYEVWLSYVRDYNFPKTSVSWIFVKDLFFVFDEKDKFIGFVNIHEPKNFKPTTYHTWKKNRSWYTN